jgi:HEAT repeat protein
MGLFDRFKKNGTSTADREVQDLIAKMEDPDWQVRYQAAQKLGAMGSRARAAEEVLQEHISDENGEVCLAASDALQKVRKATL